MKANNIKFISSIGNFASNLIADRYSRIILTYCSNTYKPSTSFVFIFCDT